MNLINKLLKVILINILCFFIIALVIDLTLGNWIKILPSVSTIPHAIWGRQIKFDVTKLYGSADKLIVTYTRDEKGYRGLKGNESKSLILAIGGSTTDERSTDDGKEWTSVLSKLLPSQYAVVNGGVQGHSAYGHLYSLKNWHAVELNPNQVKLIIFYLGVNEYRLILNAEKGLSEYDNGFYSENSIVKLKFLLRKNSYIYKEISLFKEQLSMIFDYIKGKNSKESSPIFLVDSNSLNTQLIKIKGESELPGFFYYKNLIKDLLTTSKNIFPSAKVLFVQQQIPGCSFFNPRFVQDRNVYTNTVDDLCNILGKVYSTQDQAILELPLNIRPKIIQMYLKEIIEDKDMIDIMHTKPTGSAKIANFLNPYVNEELKHH